MKCRHYFKQLTEENRHYVNAPEYNNCVLCVVKAKGRLTQEEVGNYLGISKMRVSQIERKALKNFKKKLERFNISFTD